MNAIVSPSDSAAEQRLLLAARRLFCREGIHATGVARLLDEAGVARRTLYQRFGSKDNLLKAVFAAEAAMWYAWFDVDLPARAAGPRERVLALFDILGEWFDSDAFFGCIFLNAVAEHDKQTSWVRDIAADHREAVDARVARLLRAARICRVTATTAKLSLIVDGAIVTAMVTGDRSAATTARAIASDVLDANAAPPRRLEQIER